MGGLITTTAVLLLIVVGVPPGAAQSGQKGRMMGNYNPKTELTIRGTVESIDRVGYANMSGMGIHLVVKTGNEATEVHLGPAAFIDKSMTFEKGDTVQITGSKVTMVGKTIVIAREVEKAGKVLKLRDENGVPVWSRGRRRIS